MELRDELEPTGTGTDPWSPPSTDDKLCDTRIQRPGSKPSEVGLPVRFLGRYRIEAEIASGAFGTVYRAFDPGLNRSIALKIPRRRPGEEHSSWPRTSLLQEARLAAALQHPKIVTIHDVGTLPDGSVFFAMEFVEGLSLAHRLREGPLPVDEAVRVLIDVAEAVQYAHQHGIVHRDLKPGNVLLDRHGQVKVSDFGLAASEAELFRQGVQVSGTPRYMSPEQVLGRVHQLDGRSDIWGLGVMLYECLTGRPPFMSGDPDALREEILCRPAKPLRQLDPRIPQAVEEICLKCLQKDATLRWSNAYDVAEALRGLGRSGPTKPADAAPPVVSLPVRGLGRIPLTAAAFATAIVAVWTIFGGAIGRRPAGETGPAAAVPSAALHGAAVLPTSNTADDTVNLLKLEPDPFAFPTNDPFSHFSRADDGRITITTKLVAAIRWQVPQPERFRWKSQWLYDGSPGGLSLLWNLRPVTTAAGAAGYQCHGLRIASHVRPGELLLNLQTISFAGQQPGEIAVTESRVVASRIVPAAANRRLDIELQVSGSRLIRCDLQGQRVEWTGEETGRLTLEPQNSALNVGVVVYSGECALIESSFQKE